MSGNCELGRGVRRREKNATEPGAGRFEKPAPDARAAPSEAHESFIGRKTVEDGPLAGLSFLGILFPIGGLARSSHEGRDYVQHEKKTRLPRHDDLPKRVVKPSEYQWPIRSVGPWLED